VTLDEFDRAIDEFDRTGEWPGPAHGTLPGAAPAATHVQQVIAREARELARTPLDNGHYRKRFFTDRQRSQRG
jgi:hypothetical protein